ncbi:IclR family transcriptional regulator [Ruania alkalisoli]|uniref:IclR family transcriptional regulator n=1 Tax=Ruania alkalisoli TaxID=2779775 RepID=A0A7M1SXQ0_9MICO|nr:IclR family transcriptional regulator [Ruania alkalisoli]QOR71807.1 IclR family transcriptional regulator [Ruania alkalisoli]
MSSTAAVPREPSGRTGVRALARGLAVLDAVGAADDGIGVTEVSRAVGIDKATGSRLLATLRDAGYVRQREDRRFELGSRAGWLAQRYVRRVDELCQVAGPHLAKLRDETQETVHLAIQENTDVVYLAQEVPERSVRVHSAIGTRLPMYRTAMGRAIIAELPEPERERLIGALLREADRSGDEIDPAVIEADVESARRRGWAAIDRHDDVTRLAAAIGGPEGAVVGAIALSGPSYRMEDRITERAAQVRSCARRIAASLVERASAV